MVLKPQDIVVLLKLVVLGHSNWSYSMLASELEMSQSEVHAATKRAVSACLAYEAGSKIVPNIKNILEFIVHGLKYMCAPERGKLCVGVPTLFAAPPLHEIRPIINDLPHVWPDSSAQVKGLSFSPLYKSVPKAAKKDSELYSLLALVDAIRGGCAVEQQRAEKELMMRFDAVEFSDPYIHMSTRR